MIGKMIAAVVGEKLAENTPKMSGPTGAALGVVAAMAMRRLSLPTMLAMAAGGYVAKRLGEKARA